VKYFADWLFIGWCLLVLTLCGFAGYGWVMNIVKFIHACCTNWGVEQVVRLVGIPVGLIGIVMGYL
jgi:hypothetical protein